MKDYDGSDYPDETVESSADFAGIPDGFQRLWTPHRIAYIEQGPTPDDAVCVFCTAPGLSDEQALIVHRGELGYVILNLFPYNSGHLMVCPYRHVPDYTDLSADEVAEFGDFTQRAVIALRTAMAPHGFNLGMNQGHVAGAGIAAHLHQHVVPRWGGDTNFMPIVGHTRVLPQLLEDARQVIAAAWS